MNSLFWEEFSDASYPGIEFDEWETELLGGTPIVSTIKTTEFVFFETHLKTLVGLDYDFESMIDSYNPKRDEHNSNGAYVLHVFIRGKPWAVAVDRLFPFKDGKLAFVSSTPKRMWPNLLEKALAKALGTYDHLRSGFP